MSARVFKDTDFLDAVPSTRTFSEDDFADTPAPRYFTNPADQAIAETPVVRQVFRGAANTLDTVKSMALRGKAVFNSAIDDRGGAYDALKQADAIDAEKARREAEFQKTSGTAGNIGAGVVESLTLAAPAAMMGGAPAAIGAASASQGNQAYYEGKQAGLTGTDLAQHVAMQTLLEGAPAAMSQIAGVGGLEKRLAALGEPVQRGVKAALARFGKTSLEELPEELVTTLTQQIAGAQAGTGTASPQDLANGAFQTTLQTLATAGLVESPSITRGAVDAMRRPAVLPSSDTPANAAPPGDMNLTLTPEQPAAQSDIADIFAMFDEPATQPAPAAPTAPAGRRAPDTLPPLPPGAEIPVQGITAPTAPTENPRVAPVAPGSAVLRPVPTLTPEQQAAWMAEADAMAPAEQEIVADYLMENPGNPEQLSPGEIVARSNRDIWRFTPEQQAEYEKAMGVTAQESEVIGNEEKRQEAPLLSAETGAGVDVPAPASSPASSQGSPVPQQQVATTTGLERLTWNELTSMSEEANRGRDASTLQSVLDEVRARKAIGNSGPRLATTPTPAPAPTPTLPAPEPATSTPIRFKRSGKGNAAVHEATVEGRAVSIAKGKDGWEVRLDGEVADVLPTLADARGYATGELRQDLVDQRNAAEEEAGALTEGVPPEPEWSRENPPLHRMPAGDLGAFKKAERVRAARAALENAKKGREKPGIFLNGHKSKASLVRAREQELQDAINRPDAEYADVWGEVTHAANQDYKPNIPDTVVRSVKSSESSQLIENLMSKGYVLRGDEWVHQSRLKQGPAPADTGIYRDLTAAAREGKRNAAEEEMLAGEASAPATDLVSGMIQESQKAVADLRGRISNVKPSTPGKFTFNLDGTTYESLEGDYVVGLDKETDAGIANKQLLQGLAKPIQKTNKPKGNLPPKADTGIYRDLTAAAREGKRFVAELHERIVPALERIYQQSKNAVDFMKRAVAKIGEHIRPYAKRFIAEVKRGVRATNAEFRQNPTRGSVPIEGKSSEQAPMAKAPKGEQTRASGLAQGQREGVNRQRSDLKAMLALAKEVLPPDEWKAIANTGRKIANIKGKSEAAQRRALNRILERKMGEIEHARALKSAKDSIKKARKGFKKLRPEVQAIIDEVLRGKRVKGVSQAAYDRMLQLVAEVTAGTRTGVSPATLARASKAISDFENPDLQDMKDMTAEELSGIADQINQALQLNDSLNEGLAAERERQKELNKQAPKEVEARAPIALQHAAFENSMLRSISEGTLSLSNIVRGIVGKGGHVFKTLVSDLVEADTKTLMYLRKHTEAVMARLREAGITPDKLAAMSRTLNPKAGEVEVAGVKMTKGERISLLLHLADPNTRASLLNPKSKGFEFSRAESGPNRTLKVTEDTARAIEESATPDERKVASIFWDWANGDLRDDVNEWSRRVLGYDMFTSDQHWNRRRKITDGEPAVGLLAGDFNTAQQEAGAYLKERTGGTSPIVVDDAFQHFSSHVNATSALMGKFEASVNARRLLATNEFQQAIKKNRRTGDQIFHSINKRINDWGSIAPPKSDDRLLGAVRWLGRRYSAAKLSVNLPVIISQPFSILSAAKIIPMKHITKAILGGETVHESVKREIAETPEAADLYYIINGGGHHVVTPGSITGTTAGQIFGTEKDSPLERSMVLIQRGNNVAVSGIWRAAKAWGREQGLTGDELMKFTAKTARDAWLQTQPSNSSVYHPGLKISARTNSIAYAMTMFQGQTSIQFQDAIDAIRDYQELPAAQQTAAEKAKVLAKAARPIVLQAILFYGLKYGMEKAWEELFGRSDSKKKSDKKLDPAYDKLLDIAKSPITSIPGIGPVLDGIIEFAKRKATGQAVFGSAFDNPVVDAAGNITGLPGHLVEAAQAYRKGKEVPVSAIRGILSAGEAVTGLPINNIRGWIEGIDRAVRDKR